MAVCVGKRDAVETFWGFSTKLPIQTTSYFRSNTTIYSLKNATRFHHIMHHQAVDALYNPKHVAFF